MAPWKSLSALSLLLAGGPLAVPARAQAPAPAPPTTAEVKKDVPYVPTPQAVVDRMIALAEVKEGDLVYDLGCGDGRIVIAAVKKPGVRGVCVDIDPARIAESRTNAEAAGVSNHIRFVEGDIFTIPFADATVVTMYLLPSVNMRLRPRLLNELRPGTRIVSHAFDLGDWKAEQQVVEQGSMIYRWTVPPRAEGAGR
ncbi:MAG TPA: class I SAM-dependent methyltransferase [Vicinamibacteria bacterium]|nr:class I SAM-dependent methyltransferase [Vicinamibacteria bacterium]